MYLDKLPTLLCCKAVFGNYSFETSMVRNDSCFAALWYHLGPFLSANHLNFSKATRVPMMDTFSKSKFLKQSSGQEIGSAMNSLLELFWLNVWGCSPHLQFPAHSLVCNASLQFAEKWLHITILPLPCFTVFLRVYCSKKSSDLSKCF